MYTCNFDAAGNGQTNGETRIFTIEPLILACDTHHPRLMEVALEGFHFMIGRRHCHFVIFHFSFHRLNKKNYTVFAYLFFSIEHGFLNSLKEENSISHTESSSLATSMIEAVCKCSEEYDEAVQLQVGRHNLL